MKRDGSRQHVCRVMFAHTFGMLPNSDFIYRLLQKKCHRRVPEGRHHHLIKCPGNRFISANEYPETVTSDDVGIHKNIVHCVLISYGEDICTVLTAILC